MNVVAKPSYRLSPEYLWLRKFRGNKKALAILRERAVKAFYYSIDGENILDYRITKIAVEIMERFWAARYPEIVDIPIVQVYDTTMRGDFFYRANNNIGALTNLSQRFEMPITNGYMQFKKEHIQKLN